MMSIKKRSQSKAKRSPQVVCVSTSYFNKHGNIFAAFRLCRPKNKSNTASSSLRVNTKETNLPLTKRRTQNKHGKLDSSSSRLSTRWEPPSSKPTDDFDGRCHENKTNDNPCETTVPIQPVQKDPRPRVDEENNRTLNFIVNQEDSPIVSTLSRLGKNAQKRRKRKNGVDTQLYNNTITLAPPEGRRKTKKRRKRGKGGKGQPEQPPAVQKVIKPLAGEETQGNEPSDDKIEIGENLGDNLYRIEDDYEVWENMHNANANEMLNTHQEIMTHDKIQSHVRHTDNPHHDQVNNSELDQETANEATKVVAYGTPAKIPTASRFANGATGTLKCYHSNDKQRGFHIEHYVTDSMKTLVNPNWSDKFVMAFFACGFHEHIQGCPRFVEPNRNITNSVPYNIQNSVENPPKWLMLEPGHHRFISVGIRGQCPKPYLTENEVARKHRDHLMDYITSYCLKPDQEDDECRRNIGEKIIKQLVRTNDEIYNGLKSGHCYRSDASVYTTNQNFSLPKMNNSNQNLLMDGTKQIDNRSSNQMAEDLAMYHIPPRPELHVGFITIMTTNECNFRVRLSR